MKRAVLFVLLVLIVITPLQAVTELSLGRSETGLSEDVPEILIDDRVLERESEGDVNLDTMYFTETASFDDGIYYVCRRGIGAVAYFGASMIKYLSGGTVFTVKFTESNRVVPEGEYPTGSKTNYIYGNDPSEWKTGIRDYSVLRYPEIYPGIDLVYKVKDGNLKYEFVVRPYADPDIIRFDYTDAESIELECNAVFALRDGQKMADTELQVFQEDGKARVECQFSRDIFGHVIFELGEYDPSLELVIDPVFLAYSTYLGGSDNDFGNGIAVENGFFYITGETRSSGFPTASANDTTYNGGGDCFVSKFSADGQSLVYSTFLGGSNRDIGYDIAVEDSYAFVIGYTQSSDFPTASANDTTYNGGGDCFVSMFSADGQSLVYSTFLGGSDQEFGRGIAVEDGHVFVTGDTDSPGFPTASANDTTYNGGGDCFVSKFSADGQSLVYSTFLGGSDREFGHGIAVEDGHAFVTGHTGSTDFPTVNAYDPNPFGETVFLTKLATDGQSLIYSTHLGGSDFEIGCGIAVEDGCAYVTGYTWSYDFPVVSAYDSTSNGHEDCFVTKFAADGQSLLYSTYLGGSDNDFAHSIAVEDGNAYITGYTYSTDFPVVNAYDPTYDWVVGFEGEECYVSKLAADGQSLVYSTFLGSSGHERGQSIEVANGCAYVTGWTQSQDFPTVSAYDSTYNWFWDCFMSVFDEQDSDSDGLCDWAEENLYSTNPHCIDTDNDNFLDAYEAAYGSNATDPMDYPAMPQAWYDEIYEDLDGNAALIQNLIIWSDGNASLIETVKQQLDENATLLQQVISWLDGNHSAIESLFTYHEGNATLLLETIDSLDGNATLIQQLSDWLDGNHTAIEDLYKKLDGNATLLMQTVVNLNENTTLIQNLLTWSASNSTMIHNLLQTHESNATLLQQVLLWLNGNHTAIETLLTYVEGNVTLLEQTITALDENEAQLSLVAALATDNHEWLQTLNSTAIGNITLIRGILEELGVEVGDTDYDGLDDLDELDLGTDICCIDTDQDNLLDSYEVKVGTDPLDDDSDNDSYLDGEEVMAGTDPLDPEDYPGAPTTSTTPDGTPIVLTVAIAGGVGAVSIVVILLILKKKQLGS